MFGSRQHRGRREKINRATPASSASRVRRRVFALLCLVLGTVAGLSSTRAAAGLSRNLRDGVFSRIQDISFANIDKFSTNSLVTRMTTDVMNVQNAVMMILRVAAKAPISIVCALIMAFATNWQIVLLYLVVIPVLFCCLMGIARVTHPIFRRVFKTYDRMNTVVQENVRGIRVVKAFVRGDFERKKFKKSNDELRDAGLAAVMRVILISPVMMLSMYAAILGVMWFGGGFVARGELLPGELYAFFSYIVQVLMSVLMVGMCLLMLTRAVACARRVSEVLEA